MKEKFKKIIKNKYFKITLFFTLGVLILQQSYAVYVDMYNFGQLEKAKPILESIPADTPKFYSLKKFNELYKADIKPIENCYYVSNENGKEKYIFGFKLESWLFQMMYLRKSYFYYQYDLGVDHVCIKGPLGCYDNNLYFVNKTISNPCGDEWRQGL